MNIHMLRTPKTVFKWLKRVFLVVIVYFALISIFIFFIQKNRDRLPSGTNSIVQSRNTIYGVIENPSLKKTTRGKIIIGFYRMNTCFLIGEGCTNNKDEGNVNFSGSLFGKINAIFIYPYTHPPASGILWVYQGLQNSGFVPHTYAAGIGFGSLQPLSEIWKAFRDIAYLVIVLVLITIGFMVMFRTKINPQTVISIENSLPNIVIVLLLITFSFAIAGFLIDLMYLIIAGIISVLSKPGGYDIAQKNAQYLQAGPLQLVEDILSGDWFSKLWALPNGLIGLFGPLGTIVHGLVTAIITFVWTWPFVDTHLLGGSVQQLFPALSASLVVGAIWDGLKGLFGHTIEIGLGATIGFLLAALLLQLLLMALILVSVIVNVFRILFMLMESYIKIILLTILAPILILVGALPGQQAFSFSIWLKNILAELLSFPVVIFIFIIGNIIVNISSSPATSGNLFVPPYFFPLGSSIFTFLIGMAILFTTPDLVKMFKQIVLPKPMPFPSVGPGVFFGGAKAGVEGGIGEISKYSSFGMAVPAIGGILEKFGIKPSYGHGCLPGSTLIDTPQGQKLITEIQVGDSVWTADELGMRQQAIVIKTNKQPVPSTHQMLHIAFEDGRTLTASPNHPTFNYQLLDSLVVSEGYNNSFITKLEKLDYIEEFTYDILASGSTGNYWAEKVLIGSTLKQ